jgi:hypothetical protein
MAGNANSGRRAEKPFRDALRMELAAIGDDHKALRQIARNLIKMAMDEEGKLDAIKELADRSDGKVAQAIVGDDEQDPISVVSKIVREIVRPQPNDPNR